MPGIKRKNKARYCILNKTECIDFNTISGFICPIKAQCLEFESGTSFEYN